jgi:hypothetical protein
LSAYAQDMYSEVPIPANLKGNKSFEFLQRDLRRTGLMGQGVGSPPSLGAPPGGGHLGGPGGGGGTPNLLG